MRIADKKRSVLIVAEAGINHNGQVGLAKKMIDEVKKAGADCVKFQTFKASEFVTDLTLTYTYKSQSKEVTEPQLEMFKRMEFSKKQWKEIIDYCQKRRVAFSTTAQNPSDLEMILSLTDLPFIKVGSDDLTNIGLLAYYAKKKKPMVISAGMAYAEEIGEAVNTIRKTGNNDITVLHCVSSYPADAEEVNLKKILAIKEKFGVEVGFSDHTVGSMAAVGAVCLGAVIIEKHFTLSHDLPGPDHWFSMDVSELKKYVQDVRFIEKAIGDPALAPTAKEKEMREIARRSIVVRKNIKAGEKFLKENLECKRPGTGLEPKYLSKIVGKIAKKDYFNGQILTQKDL